MEFDNIQTFVVVLLAIMGSITVIWTAIKNIKEMFKPKTDLAKIVENHDELLDNDNKRLNSLEQSTSILLRCQLAQLDHEISGNSVEKLKKAKDELAEYLIER